MSPEGDGCRLTDGEEAEAESDTESESDSESESHSESESESESKSPTPALLPLLVFRLVVSADLREHVPMIHPLSSSSFPVLAALLLAAPLAAEERKTLDLYFIDTEGGAATLIVTPAGETVL